MMTLASFKEILYLVSGLATKGCLFMGELPVWLAETEVGIKVTFLYFPRTQCFSVDYVFP